MDDCLFTEGRLNLPRSPLPSIEDSLWEVEAEVRLYVLDHRVWDLFEKIFAACGGPACGFLFLLLFGAQPKLLLLVVVVCACALKEDSAILADTEEGTPKGRALLERAGAFVFI